MAGPSRRSRVSLFFAGFLVVIALDGFHRCGDAHGWLEDKLNPVLAFTGLWQGPWRLYAPDVDKDNLRLEAEVVFSDRATATWRSPDWPAISALRKFVLARHMNYLNGILLAGKEPAWNALCAHLARSVPHPQGKPAVVEEIRLRLRGATIPPPSERVVPAGPYLAFDDWNVIWTWRPGT